jgi:hypothetical protein
LRALRNAISGPALSPGESSPFSVTWRYIGAHTLQSRENWAAWDLPSYVSLACTARLAFSACSPLAVGYT